MFDIIIYNSKTILKIIAHFDIFLAGTHFQVYGEYATTAYSREKIAYPSHSVKLKALKCNTMVYEVEPTGDPSHNLLYDLLVAQKIYENWTDRSIRAARVSHEDFYDKYNKLHLDFLSEPDVPVDPPPVVVVLDNNLSEKQLVDAR
ncbi:unnamed protein product [Mucor circinelloides]